MSYCQVANKALFTNKDFRRNTLSSWWH